MGLNSDTHREETVRPHSDRSAMFTRFPDTLTGADMGSNIAEADALRHVAGLTGFRDASVATRSGTPASSRRARIYPLPVRRGGIDHFG